MCASISDVFLGLLAILLPPLPVWIKTGVCSGSSLLNIILCILGYIPGLLHAWYIIASVDERPVYYYERVSPGDLEAGRSRVPGPAGQASAPGGYVAPPAQLGPRVGGGAGVTTTTTYGTIDGERAGANASAAPAPTGEEGEQGAAPPTYDQAIRGDNKVQR